MTPLPKDPPSPVALRRRRVALCLTAHDLADMVGIGAEDILSLERGTAQQLPTGSWEAICTALRLDDNWGRCQPPPLAAPPHKHPRNQGTPEPLPSPGPPPSPKAPWWVRLRLQRRRLGMSLSEASREARINIRRITCLEAGSHPATSEHLDAYRALACGLAIDPPELPVLPTINTAWLGFKVGGRMERGYRVSAQLASSSSANCPAGSILLARLQNGWSRARTAKACGTSDPQSIEAEESRRAWPSRPGTVLARLMSLWRVAPKSSGGSKSEAETVSVIVQRATAICEEWGFNSEDLCILCDLSPASLDALLLGDLSRRDRIWDAVATITAHGLDVASGLRLPKI